MSEDIVKGLADQINTKIDAFRTEVDAVKGAVDGLDAAKFTAMQNDISKSLAEKTALETKMAADKTALEARISALETEKSQPDYKSKSSAKEDLVKAAWDKYVRAPTEINETGYNEVLLKSMNLSAPAAGGLLVEPVLGAQILKELTDLSPMRSIAKVMSVANEQYKDIMRTKATSGWVGELDPRVETDGPEFASTGLEFGEIYANIRVSNHLLNDASFNIEKEIVESVLEQFAKQEGIAFVSGNGVNKPVGFAFGGAVPTTTTGFAGSLGDPETGLGVADAMVRALYALKVGYRRNAAFLMNSQTLGSLSVAKDSTGRYLLDTITLGGPVRLIGKPVYEDEGIASVGAGSVPIYVGDFNKGYTIADITNTMTMIKENVTEKGYTHFYISKRVGGGVTMAEAIRGVRVAV